MIWVGLILFLLLLPDLVVWGKLLLLRPRLNAFCKEKGYEITWHRAPFPWALRYHRGYDFTVTAGKAVYRVHLVAARRRNREYLFASAAHVVINRMILTKIVGGKLSWRRMDLHPVVSASRNRQISLFGDNVEGETKVLLLYPVARDVAWDSTNGGRRPLGSGDLFWNSYRFFTLSGLLDEMTSPGKYLRETKPWEYD